MELCCFRSGCSWIDSAWIDRREVGAVKGAESGIRAFRGSERGVDLASGVSSVDSGITFTRNIPNPYGSKGSPAHQAKVAEITKDIESRGLTSKTEFTIKNPVTGATRRADVIARSSTSKEILEVHQVVRITQSGEPIARERRALTEIKSAVDKLKEFVKNVKIKFTEYKPKSKKSKSN